RAARSGERTRDGDRAREPAASLVGEGAWRSRVLLGTGQLTSGRALRAAARAAAVGFDDERHLDRRHAGDFIPFVVEAGELIDPIELATDVNSPERQHVLHAVAIAVGHAGGDLPAALF